MWQGKTYNCDYTLAKIIKNSHGDIPSHANLPCKSFLHYVEYIPSLAGMTFASLDAQNSSLGTSRPDNWFLDQPLNHFLIKDI